MTPMRTRRKKRRRKKKRIGISLLVLLAAVLPSAIDAGQKRSKIEPYATVGGTVFQESGFALPNAVVTLTAGPQAGGSVKIKKQQTISDARGEFVFRVPAITMNYAIKVAAKGYISQEKPAAVEGEGRVDVTFQLQPESK